MDNDDGFTLVELMVVVLILGILMAIAIPTFLGVTSNARSNGTMANLTTAAEDEGVYLTSNGQFAPAGDTSAVATAYNVAALKTEEDGITWLAGTATTSAANPGDHSVSVWVVSPAGASSEIIMSDESTSGNLWYWVDDKAGTLTYAQSTTSTEPASITSTTVP